MTGIPQSGQPEETDTAGDVGKGQHGAGASVGGRWPLGPEVRRTSVERGAMLYDSSRAGNLTLAWFDVRHWQSLDSIEGSAAGRGMVRFVEAEDGLKLVLRPYRRGGLVARVLSRHYVWRGEQGTRPFREWLLTYRMHRAGLPVAAPIAAHYRRRMGLYTGELITERLPVKGTLAECLLKDSLSVRTWIAIGRCIRRFHDFGVCHADLNVRNILVGEDGTVYLIDFDRCSLRSPGLWRDSNLVRLRRSLEKVTYGLPRERFTEADWHALLDGYRQGAPKPREPAPAPAAAHVPAAAAVASPAPAMEPVPEAADPVEAASGGQSPTPVPEGSGASSGVAGREEPAVAAAQAAVPAAAPPVPAAAEAAPAEAAPARKEDSRPAVSPLAAALLGVGPGAVPAATDGPPSAPAPSAPPQEPAP